MTQPITRLGRDRIARYDAAGIDGLEHDVPSSGPPCDWKYHQGMPFCAGDHGRVAARAARRAAARARGGCTPSARGRRRRRRAIAVEVVGRRRMRVEVAARAQHPDAVAPASPAGASPRAISVDVAAAARERRADVGADRAGAEDREPHALDTRPVPRRRSARSRPLALHLAGGRRGDRVERRGRRSGTLNAASRSRQCASSSRSVASAARATTAAPTRSPYFASAIAEADAPRARPGGPAARPRPRSGEMFSPPRMIISLSRPSSRR